MKTRNFLALVLVFCLLLPCGVSATEPEQTRIRAVKQLDSQPECWNPLNELSEEETLLLSLTSDRLYVLSSDGQNLIPSLAAVLPVDVTQDYAGSYGIPSDASRGYAFSIILDPGAAWEDGKPITTGDFLFTINLLIDRGQMSPVPANYTAFMNQAEKPAEDIISLAEAGFETLEDAAAAGHGSFYVDVSHFWGLDAGWVSAADNNRIKDSAIPSGITEMYVSGAYLFNRYLRSGKQLSVFQTQFVGIARQPQYVNREELGLIRKNNCEFIFITEKPTTAEALALQLSALIPLRQELFGEDYATSPATYSSCGPYRIVSMENGQILLQRNESWLGKTEAPTAPCILLRSDIGT